MIGHFRRFLLFKILLIVYFGTLSHTLIISNEDCFGIYVFENFVEDIENVFNPDKTISQLIYQVNSKELVNQNPEENNYKIFSRFPKRLRSKCLVVIVDVTDIPQIVSVIQHTGLAIVKHVLYFVNTDKIREKVNTLAKTLIDGTIAGGVHPNIVLFSLQRANVGILCYLCENEIEIEPTGYDLDKLTKLIFKQNGNFDGLRILGQSDWEYLKEDFIKPDREKEDFYQRMIDCDYPRVAVWGHYIMQMRQ